MDLSLLPTAGELPSRARAERWRPGLAGPLHSEIFASGDEGSGAAVALALALDKMRISLLPDQHRVKPPRTFQAMPGA